MLFINHNWSQSFLSVRSAIHWWTFHQSTSLFHTRRWRTRAGPATGTPTHLGLGHPSPSTCRLSCSRWLCWWEFWLFRRILTIRPESTLSAVFPSTDCIVLTLVDIMTFKRYCHYFIMFDNKTSTACWCQRVRFAFSDSSTEHRGEKVFEMMILYGSTRRSQMK